MQIKKTSNLIRNEKYTQLLTYVVDSRITDPKICAEKHI